MGSIPGSVPGALVPTKEKFYDTPWCTPATDCGLGGFHGCDIAVDEHSAYINCYLPEDYHVMEDIVVVLLAGATLTPMTVRIVTNYCSNGELYTAHDEDVNKEINVTNNQLTELDISDCVDVAALAAGDYIGVWVSRDIGQNTHAIIMGVRIRYV